MIDDILDAKIEKLRKLARERDSPYNEKARDTSEIEKYGGRFIAEIIEENGGLDKNLRDIYTGYEHKPEKPEDKLPNITCFWNWPMASGFMYAQTFGHEHPLTGLKVQEVYEFWNYGVMLISNRDAIRLHVCRPGDKVAVPSECSMALLNLSSNLTTLDMANPQQNAWNKDRVKVDGPVLAFVNRNNLVEVMLNEKYGLSGKIKLECAEEDGLYQAIFQKREKFREKGIDIVDAHHSIVCERQGIRYKLDRPLFELATGSKFVHKLLGIV